MNLYDEERLSKVDNAAPGPSHADRKTECMTCPNCQGSGRMLQWRYRLRCVQVQPEEFRLLDRECSLQRLLENAVRQRDFSFENDALFADEELIGGDGWIAFDSYSSPCSMCGGKGRI